MHQHHEHAHASEATPHLETVVNAEGEEVTKGQTINPGDLWQCPTGTPPRTLWLDVTEGIAGDMLLAALIDAGADGESVAKTLDLVAPGKLHLQQRTVQRGAFRALKVDVIADEKSSPHRHLSDIAQMINGCEIASETKKMALAIFQKLAHAEAYVHGSSIEDVHFHEVGALDSIGDIVGVAEALRTLNVKDIYASTVAVGAGTITIAHGTVPVPPPAVAYLAVGYPICAGGPYGVGELCTPTGLAILRASATHRQTMPEIVLHNIGMGAGSRVRSDRAGLVRAYLGTSKKEHHD